LETFTKENNNLKSENIKLKNSISELKKESKIKKTNECLSLYNNFKNKYIFEEEV
jgi:hypothetical protein